MTFLSAFAQSLCRDREFAEDLMQETLVRAWKARSRYAAGTNLKAWLFTILKNLFYSHLRSSHRHTSSLDQETAESFHGAVGEQYWAVALSDTERALAFLSEDHRTALILVGVGGLSAKDAALICKCPLGTLKSRVSRARKLLVNVVDGKTSLGSAARTPAIDTIERMALRLDGLCSDTKV